MRVQTVTAWLLAIVLFAAGSVTVLLRDVGITSWAVLWNAMSGAGGESASVTLVRQQLVAPEGFRVSLYAADVPKARWLHATTKLDLLVTQPRLGQVLLLRRDADGDGLPDGREILLGGLERPHGIDLADGWLYIGEGSAIGRARFDEESGRLAGPYRRILEGLPAGGNHWSRTVRVGPDGWIYVSIGSSCNVCAEEHPWRAAMIRARPDGSEAQIHATGLRNSVGFDWAPWNGELYATDNGRDLLGDDFPPCELNRIVSGGFYGWPYINGDGVIDPDLGAGHEQLLATAISPAHPFRAHNAPLGIRFIRHPDTQSILGRAALVALHGSWNRSVADGYKVVLLQWDESGAIRESDFLSGFERDGHVIGRPVDVTEAVDGSIFVSDDYASAIYRIVAGEQSVPASVQQDIIATVAAPNAEPLAGIGEVEISEAQETGRTLMRKHDCRSCHLAGTPVGDKLLSVRERYGLAELASYFTQPTPPMPDFALSESERRALAIHLLSGGAAKD